MSDVSRVHEVKSWRHFFRSIKSGIKKHDLRHNDRQYQIGDKLWLKEYDHVAGSYTGSELFARITFITSRDVPCAFSGAVLDRDYCILSLEVEAEKN